MNKCPHPNIVDCPLYLAMHIAGFHKTCNDGRLDEGGCAVKRGASYSRLLADLKAVAPEIIAENEAAVRARLRRQDLIDLQPAGRA